MLIDESIKVSIIMPVYNGDSYLNTAILSILNQSYKNFELIIIDDGSNDKSRDVISSFKDERIVYYYKNNEGIALARNKGIELAQGEYICFLDQDDWYENDAIELMLSEIKLNDYDLLITSYRLIDIEGKVISCWKLDENSSWTKYRIVAPWGRMYKKAIIDEYNIRFLNTKISEDLYFNLLFFSYTNKIGILNHITYNWLYNKKSESRTNWNKLSEDRNPLVMLDILYSRINNSKNLFNNNEYPNLVYFFSKYIVWYLLYTMGVVHWLDNTEMKEKCFNWLEIHFPEYKDARFTGLFVPKGEQFKIRLCVSVYLMVHKWIYK